MLSQFGRRLYSTASAIMSNPKVFFDVSANGQKLGRIIMVRVRVWGKMCGSD